MNENDQTYSVYFGPSLVAPFAAAVVDFTHGFSDARMPMALRKAMQELLPPEIKLVIAWPEAPLNIAELVALIANGFQDIRGPNKLPHVSSGLPDGRMRVIVGFRNAEAAVMALRGAVALAHAVFARAGGLLVDSKRLAPFLTQAAAMASYQPDSIARALIRAATTRGIPVSPFPSGGGIWHYGEGIHSFHFAAASTNRDSQIGLGLSRDKYRVGEFIKSLGLPSAECLPANTPRQAVQIARRFGYPVVVKPIHGSNGRGVSIGLKDDQAVEAAFAKARGATTNLVLVERLIAGDDYRLSVFGGKLLRASRLVPPHVVGDGSSSLSELIVAENRSRSDADVASGLLIRIAVDTEMLALLREQGFGLDDVPPAGSRLLLRRNSNLATGGKLEDVTDELHDDNRLMAETIARALHLDAAGIDFMTIDPSRSWRDGDAAVIEVNAAPGIGDVIAERVIAQKFKTDGRIPSVLVVDSNHKSGTAVAEILSNKGLRVGEVTPDSTRLGSERRFRGEAALPERIRALLVDPACEALVVTARPDEIAQCGLPHARFGLALVTEPGALSPEVDRLIATHVGRVLRDGDQAMLATQVERFLTIGDSA